MAVSYLYHFFGPGFRNLPLPLFRKIDSGEIHMLTSMIDQSLNTPLISSSGRLFDAMAAILGINYRATYQAEAPMKLEAIADPREKGTYPFEIREGVVCFYPMFEQVIGDLEKGTDAGIISGRFHNSLVRLIRELALQIRAEKDINRVVLSGGSFQNRILTRKIYSILTEEGFTVYISGQVPANDQGICVGQLAVGSAVKNRL